MKNENELVFFIREKEEAVKQYNQSKILIEKLEEELKNVKELSPTGDKNVYNVLYKEYVEIINILSEKVKTVQEKYRDEVCKNSEKEGEIKYLNEKINEMGTKLNRAEEECVCLGNLLKQYEEKYLQMEKQLMVAEDKLFSTERKYQCLNIIRVEEERDQLQLENYKLSSECKEQEVALEICHKTIQSYEEKLCQMTTRVDSLVKEKDVMTKKEISNREEIAKLEEIMCNVKTENRKANEELKLIRENYNEDIEQLVLQFSGLMNEEDRSEVKTDDDFNFKDFSKTRGSIFKLYKLLKNFKEALQKTLNEKRKLQVKMDVCQWDIEKHKNEVTEMAITISGLRRKLLIIQKQLRRARQNPNMRKYIRNVEVANFELLKQIKSQENLHDKWKKGISELIQKFQNRIVELYKNYQKLQKENTKIKSHLNMYSNNIESL